MAEKGKYKLVDWEQHIVLPKDEIPEGLSPVEVLAELIMKQRVLFETVDRMEQQYARFIAESFGLPSGLLGQKPKREPPKISTVDFVLGLKESHRKTWRKEPQRKWVFGLLEEVWELLLSLIGLHEGPPDWELAQIAAICMNWMEMREDVKK